MFGTEECIGVRGEEVTVGTEECIGVKGGGGDGRY